MFCSRNFALRRQLTHSKAFFCSQEKCYIIKTSDKGKTVVTDVQIMKKFRENQSMQLKHSALKEKFWKKIILLLKQGQRETTAFVKKLKIDEKFVHFTTIQTVKWKTNISIIQDKLEPTKIKQQVAIFRDSEMLKKFMEWPGILLIYSRIAFNRAHHYFGIFMKSATRYKLESVLIWSWTNGKFVVLRVLRFIHEAYFDKSPKKIGNS